MRGKLALVLLVAGLATACTKQEAPYMDVIGGGFIFNYRLAIAFAGVVVVPLRAMPDKSEIEVSIENPAGGAPIIMRQAPTTRGKIEFNTEPLTGIKVDTDYDVTVRLVAADGKELQRVDKVFRSNVDQSILPEAPLTIGPGYTPNPNAPKPQ
jgi:hypothetical protein